MHDVAIRPQTSSRNFILVAGLLLYCGAFAILLGNQSFEIAGAVIVLVAFEIVLPLMAWIKLATLLRSRFPFSRAGPN